MQIDVQCRGMLALCSDNVKQYLFAVEETYNPVWQTTSRTQRPIFRRSGDGRVAVGLGAIKNLQENNPVGLEIDVRGMPTHPPIDLSGTLPGIEWRDYQRDALDELERHDLGVVEIPTAAGKTYVELALARACALHGNVVILVPSRVLRNQFIKRASSVGIELTNYKDVRGRAVPASGAIFIDIPTAMHRDAKQGKGDDFFASVTALIIDECHHAGASTYRECLDYMPSLSRVHGFSGTAYAGSVNHDFRQMDVATAMTVSTVGSSIYSREARDLKQYVDCPDVVNFHYQWSNDWAENLSTTNYSEVREILKANIHRAGVIAGILDILHVGGRTAICPVQFKASGEAIMRECRTGSAVCWYGGGKVYNDQEKFKEDDLAANIANRKATQIIATNHIDEGLDMEEIDTVVLSQGRSKRQQIQRVGRSARQGSKRALVVNFHDDNQVTLWAQAVRRARDISAYYGTEVHDVGSVRELAGILADY